ncbi:MmpS family transport accessory protein [Saccharothrix texasensis]|uniref:MmpS family membrane protein n=1 Tax=Saccharothrix texasensis TaxID=103734 RepID=A0A3N1HBE4_9PSEU|nr:MmpS family transport accessory protein [Saccharothrix texasensis]ROP39830.1 MmpS family membrane protein [Saccharothrix texasensis]
MSDPQRNGPGTAGFVLGLLGLVTSFVPLLGVVAWSLVLAGLALGLLGLLRVARGQADNKGLATAAVVLSALGLVVSVAWVALFGRATSDAENALDDLQTRADKGAVLLYEVTGDASGATVSYSTFGATGSTATAEEVATLPWTKEFTVKGLSHGGTLDVTTSAGGGTVTCAVTVDGVARKTATASGPNAVASCSNF